MAGHEKSTINSICFDAVMFPIFSITIKIFVECFMTGNNLFRGGNECLFSYKFSRILIKINEYFPTDL
jgi:hypothetical protein